MTSLKPPPIDRVRYPLDAGDTAAVDALVSRCRRQLDAQQYCSLPGFFAADEMTRLVEALLPLMPEANRAESWRNCYLQREPQSDYADDHPRNRFNYASYHMLAADLLQPDSALKQLYYWPPFQQLVASIVGVERLYPSEDPLQPVNVICYGDGDQSAWHYDSTNAFTMTLMLQAAEAGGRFELAPNTRNGVDDEDLDYMQQVMDGDCERARPVSRTPGELTIFRGCNSLHRVTKVSGAQLRMMAIFVYEEEPGIRGDPEVNRTVYGRSGLEA